MSTPVSNEYFPTIIDSRSLLPRLASELKSVERECKDAWPDFKRHPVLITGRLLRSGSRRVSSTVLSPHALVAFIGVALISSAALLVDRIHASDRGPESAENNVTPEITILELEAVKSNSADNTIGRNGAGRVGFANGNGEGSAKVRGNSQGGGGGGDNEPRPPQTGKLPPPSNIFASIPKTPPIQTPTLPAAGIDIDPALWKDEKAAVFGDPRSDDATNSKGPGTGGGIGTNRGLGIGEGEGPGVGPGKDGNTGNGSKQLGCCGSSGGSGDGPDQVLQGREVEQRARLLLKPEPQYTEEARRNSITGTVMLRVVFSSFGRVEQIRALQTLPFGLTEKAIAAARQIKFVPATKGGRPVSVWMQLEYNFNLY